MQQSRTSGVVLVAALLWSGMAVGQWSANPAEDLDSQTLRVQTKVEGLYQRRDYERALFIYLNELAPVGDKYAQYMVGYMHLMGQGTARDPVLASAWYRLAAERAIPQFEAVRDELLASLDEDQRLRSDALYADLRGRYSDLAIVMQVVIDAYGDMGTQATGSRLASDSGIVTVVDPGSVATRSKAASLKLARRSLRKQLDFIATQLDIEPLPVNLSSQQLGALEARVSEYLSTVDDD